MPSSLAILASQRIRRVVRAKKIAFIYLCYAYRSRDLTGGKAGRGSGKKVPFLAAVSLNDHAHPLRVKLTSVAGFTFQASRGEPIQSQLVYNHCAG